ncbi:Pre-mRNA-splicing factor srp1 [Psilocybe cubensis]|uniref:Pre-mRNA-splicing factor srp1 n=1 Tax=Psilocybe cubensis TaxID=181762 RepID=A0ACB8GPB4_PSICU|nr:Pre-mRNA-splicing factor srp1 [Psilocybe cubensis]KAH9476884.1 Pre-mRNA-splicing factor srp1 [Psilocybe cubensis]
MPRILFVSGFHPTTRARDLAYEFERYGPLVRCDVPAPRNPHATHNPYAFVEFKSNRDAEDAYYDMHGRYFEGSRLSIQWAKNPPSSVWRYERRSPPPSHRSGRDRSRSPRRRDDRDRDRDRLDDRDRDRDRRRRSRSPPPHLDRDRRRSPSPDRRRDARDRDRGDRDRGDRDRERERPKTPPAEEPVKKDEDRERERDRQDRGDNDQVRTPPYDH